MHCDWFMLLVLLLTPTIWFSPDHRQNVSNGVGSGVRKKWKHSDSSGSNSVTLMTQLTMTQLTTPTQTPSIVKTSPYPASLQALHLNN